MPAPTPSKPIVGLTGGIASGKSAVSRVLRNLGVTVVDADQLAREVVAPGSEGLAEIERTFGSDVLTGAGELDREAMGRLVFSDPSAREKLNAITHPRVAALSLERLGAAATTDTPYVVYEVPLLVETGLHRSMDAVVVVATDPATQVARMLARDGIDRAAAEARIAAQFPLADKVAVADFVVDNDASLAELEARARDLHAQLLERFGAP